MYDHFERVLKKAFVDNREVIPTFDWREYRRLRETSVQTTAV
jgi:hypothetical protein